MGVGVRLRSVRVGDLAEDIGAAIVFVIRGATAVFCVGVLGGLSPRRGARFGDLALFAVGSGFGQRGGFGLSCGFDAFRGGDADSLFGVAEGLLPDLLGFPGLLGHGGILSFAGDLFRGGGGDLRGVLGPELAVPSLFGGAVAELGAILAA
jgi:hypothetical protein